MSIRANTAIVASIIMLLLGIGAAIWLVTTPWFIQDSRAVEASGQIAPAPTPQNGEEQNVE